MEVTRARGVSQGKGTATLQCVGASVEDTLDSRVGFTLNFSLRAVCIFPPWRLFTCCVPLHPGNQTCPSLPLAHISATCGFQLQVFVGKPEAASEAGVDI